MEKLLIKSNRTFEELHKRTVEFSQGIGTFNILKHEDGRLVVDIDVNNPSGFMRYHIPQDDAQRIEDHPDQAVAHFRLL